MLKLIHLLGVQRSFLLSVTAALIALSFFSSGETVYEGWGAIPTIIAPTLVPIMLFVVGLDILMSFIYGLDAEAAVAKRYRWINRINLLSIMMLVVFWAKFFTSLVQMP